MSSKSIAAVLWLVNGKLKSRYFNGPISEAVAFAKEVSTKETTYKPITFKSGDVRYSFICKLEQKASNMVYDVDKKSGVVFVRKLTTAEKDANAAIHLKECRTKKIKEVLSYDGSTSVNSFLLNGKSVWIPHNTRETLYSRAFRAQRLQLETISAIIANVVYTTSPAALITLLDTVSNYADTVFDTTAIIVNTINKTESTAAIATYPYKRKYPKQLTLTL